LIYDVEYNWNFKGWVIDMKKIIVLFLLIEVFSGCSGIKFKSDIHNAENYINNGGLYNLEKAEQILIRLKSEFPEDFQVHYYLGLLYYNQQKWDEASDEFDESIHYGNETYFPNYYRALIFYRNGDLAEAKKELNQATAIENRQNICDPEMNKVAASIYEENMEWRDAIFYYKKSLKCLNEKMDLTEEKRKSKYADIYLRLGVLYRNLSSQAWNRGYKKSADKQAKYSEIYYKKAISYFPDDALYYYNLSSLYHWQGKLKEAVSTYKICVNKAQKSGNEIIEKRVHKQLAMIYLYLGETGHSVKYMNLALNEYDALSELDNNPIYNCKKGAIYNRLGDRESAYTELEQCCTNPDIIYSYSVKICGATFTALKRNRHKRVTQVTKIEENVEETPVIEKEELGNETEVVTTRQEDLPETKSVEVKNESSNYTMEEPDTVKQEETVNKSESVAIVETNKKANNEIISEQQSNNNEAEVSERIKPEPVKVVVKEPNVNKKNKITDREIEKTSDETIESKSNIEENKKQNVGKDMPKTTKVAVIEKKPIKKAKIVKKRRVIKKRKSFFSNLNMDNSDDIGDIDSILANQNSGKKKLTVAGVRRHGGAMSSANVQLDIEEARDIKIKKEMKKISSNLQFAENQSGKIDPKIVMGIISNHYGEVRYCYEKQLMLNPELEGKIEVKFSIGINGNVSTTTISDSSINSIEVESCVLHKVRNWHFPKPKGGSVTIIFPFIFMGT